MINVAKRHGFFGGEGSRWWLIVVIVLTVGVFSPCLTGYYLADDFSQFTRSHSELGRNVFLSHDRYIRPIPKLIMRGEFLLWGLHTTPAHITNTLLHLANALMVGLLAFRVSRNHAGSWCAALLFAVHPVHSGTINWLSARFDLFCATFLLASILKFQDHLETKSRGAIIGSVLFFLAALLSKETALCLPPVLFLFSVCCRPLRELATRWRSFMPFILIAFLAVLLRLQLVGGKMFLSSPDQHPELILPGFFLRSFELFFHPIHPLQWGETAQVLVLLFNVLLGVTAMAALFRRSFPSLGVALFGLGFFFVSLAPTLPVIARFYTDPPPTRFLYLPCAGLCLILGELLGRQGDSVRRTLLVSWALLCCVTTFGAGLVWRRAAELSESIPRDIAELCPADVNGDDHVLVQNFPKTYKGAYLFLPHVLPHAMGLILDDPPHVWEVTKKMRVPGPELRNIPEDVRLVVAAWDEETERVIDLTGRARSAIDTFYRDEVVELKWTRSDLASWVPRRSVLGSQGQGIDVKLEEAVLILRSPALKRNTKMLQLDLKVTSLGGNVRPRVGCTWRAGADLQLGQTVLVKVTPDGHMHTYEVAVPQYSWIEQLEEEELWAVIRIRAKNARLEIPSIRAIPRSRRP